MAVPRKILLGLVLVLSSSFLPHGSEAALIHRYSFTTDGSDAVGHADATLVSGATVSQEKLVLDGINDYADLPMIGASVGALNNFTVEAWVTWDQQARWGRIFDFGTNTSIFMFLTPQSNVGDAPMFQIRSGATQSLPGPPVAPPPLAPFPVGTEAHIAVSVDYSGDFAALYINGVLVSSSGPTSSAHISLRGVNLGSTTHNYLGRSQFAQDPYFKGSIDELRVYNEALTPLQVLRSYQRGPNNDQLENMPDVVVPATANLFGAGHPSLPSPGQGGSGTRPVLVRLAGGCDVVTFSSVSGAAKPGQSYGWTPTPDGLGNAGTVIESYGGIAGILHSRQMFLAGLFLDDSEPQDPAPDRLDFRPTGGDQFNDLYPGLRQIFFIGDGVTQALNAQSFHVPNGATRLYLGFADANAFGGLPGYYDDDFGSMAARVSLCGQPITAVPQSGPPEFELLGAHPNPLTGATEITFTLSKPQSVALKIFDVSGQLVRNLTDEFLAAGPHSALWDRRDDRGRPVPAGIYFYSLNTREQRKSSRMVVLE